MPTKMIMKYMLFLIITISTLCCCNSAKDKWGSKIIAFNLKQLPDISGLTLSDLGFKEIEYIPLETNEQSLLSSTEDLLLRHKILVNDRQIVIHRLNTILKFHSDGKFVTKIGSKGRGPDEFHHAHDVNIRENTQDIYLLDRWNNKFLIYSEDGKLKRTFQIQFSPNEFRFIGDKILCYSENHMANIQDSYTLIDTNGTVIKTFPNKYPFKMKDGYGIEGENLYYTFNNSLYKKEVYSDTIYEFDNECFTPHMVLQVGKKLLTTEARTQFDGRYLAKNYIMPLNLFEFGDYVYYEFIYKYVVPEEYEIPVDIKIYSFIGSKTNNFNALIETGTGLINDLDGGPNFLPRTIKNDNTIVGWIEPSKLKSHVATDDFKKSAPKYPEKKQKLEKLANSLKETDNPVLVMVRLKH